MCQLLSLFSISSINKSSKAMCVYIFYFSIYSLFVLIKINITEPLEVKLNDNRKLNPNRINTYLTL